MLCFDVSANWREDIIIKANVAAGESDIRDLQTHHEGRHDTEGYASLHPRLRATRFVRAFDLSGRAGGVVLPRIFTELSVLCLVLYMFIVVKL